MPNKKNIKKYFLISFIVLIFFCIAKIIPAYVDEKIVTYDKVKRIVDGDTIVLEEQGAVRLIGVDTPEYHDSEKLLRVSRQTGISLAAIKKLGEDAKEFTEKIANGKNVRVQFDINNNKINHIDKYNRLLAYVFVFDVDENIPNLVWINFGDKGEERKAVFLNASIIKAGYGEAYRYFQYQNKRYFIGLEKEAREALRGLWLTWPKNKKGKQGFM